jgi:hypothetical protein
MLTAWAVGVENACDAHVNAVLVVETVCQSLGDALSLIVARAWTDGVDVAPAGDISHDTVIKGPRPNSLILGLWMYLRVAVNLYLATSQRQAIDERAFTTHTRQVYYRKEIMGVPDVLVNKKRAFVRLASPSMFNVPWNDVLIVFTALNW